MILKLNASINILRREKSCCRETKKNRSRRANILSRIKKIEWNWKKKA